MLVPVLLRKANDRPVVGNGELQRQRAVRRGTVGTMAYAADTGGGLSLEQIGSVRHARKCVAMDRHGASLGPSGPGRQLARQRARLPGVGTLRPPADTPGHGS